MLGGNPLGDRYGFRYWRDPGVMNDGGNGALGRFEGFLACLINAAFLVAGPEYISMVAGEAENPRRTMPRAFTSIIYRLTAFFILGSLAVGICVPYTDPGLLSTTGPTAAASPYVLAMNRLNISVRA
jgi:amino acid transporter